MIENEKFSNDLINESSPYLLQHAHNPVHWMPWGKQARLKAIEENKLMLVSIGYSACHWCHVMEHESFENNEVAALMNQHFVCVKVDREERPDVDHVYMQAVQSMSGQGGWPLNCFTTPDGKPIYGGTYYRKVQWMQVLTQLAALWQNDPTEVQTYGDRLAKGLEVSGSIDVGNHQQALVLDTLRESVGQWRKRFDTKRGGPDKAPKFPLPCNYSFLLHYALASVDDEAKTQVECTLDAMCRGGIYDQVGGGFARYSVDADWKVPHFEKMLYDNAQLLGLYAEGYAAFRKKEYLDTVVGIKTWLQREMRNGAGGYFSAIDADSEGVEGLFYTWPAEEVSGEASLAEAYAKYYHTDARGIWEDRYIPVRKEGYHALAREQGITPEEISKNLQAFNQTLLEMRRDRIRPGTDDKSLCSWNAMLAGGFVQSYLHTGNDDDLREAKSIMAFIDHHMSDAASGKLSHSWKSGKASNEGFLEDYAWYIDACIKLYRASFEEAWLHKAKGMTLQVLDRFYDQSKGLFFFTPVDQSDLIVRPMELSDNVIPSSNAVMAHNLFSLFQYFGHSHFQEKCMKLLHAIQKPMVEYAEGYAHWADLHLRIALGAPEVVVTGPDAEKWATALGAGAGQHYRPLLTWAVSHSDSALSLFEGRFKAGETLAYICQNQSCKMPSTTISKADNILDKMKLTW
jgi:hypothetical protein